MIFAATNEHADLVVKFMKEEYTKIGLDVFEEAIQKITGKSYDPAEQVRRYKNEKYPTIAVTVDLLTTGIDVPAICNIVFLRRVRSRILYEQMLGRATRRCEEIGKEVFRIYDAVRIYEALEDYTQMKPVSPDQKVTFEQLIKELPAIASKDRTCKQVEQIIARFQRKRKLINDAHIDKFSYLTGGLDPESFIGFLKDLRNTQSIENLNQVKGIWKFLDELTPDTSMPFVSEHPDETRGIERGYGNGQKPEDYILSFGEFVNDNLNEIAALQIICTRPQELDRQSLKALRLELDLKGFNTTKLNTAWKETRNVDIAADIISYIRMMALGNVLLPHEVRIKQAVEKVRLLRPWNKIQLKWIDRFEKQLLQENVLQKSDLNMAPFKEDGGYQRLDKIFNNELELVVNGINDNLYQIA